MNKMSTSPKQVIVMRKDLNMRKGKIAAQAAHASSKVILDMMPVTIDGDSISRTITMQAGSPLDLWLNGNFKKICLGIESEEELLNIVSQAKNAGLPVALILDSGLTEFGGVPTYTCCAIGPELPEKIDPITGQLKPL